jgi:hypothetical protein
MPQSIISINATHQDPYVKNKFFFPFPSTRDLTATKLGLKSVSIYNSWNTIDPQYNNQQFDIVFPSGATNTTLHITLPAGIYSVADMNNYLRDYFIANNLYLSNNTTGDYTVYAEFRLNGTAYSIDFVSYPIPMATPSGYTNHGITLPTDVARGPQITILNNGFKTITGYNVGTYPAAQQATVYTKQSDNVPVISPVQSVNLTCDGVLNLFSANSSVIHSFTSKSAGSGSLIDSSPNEVSFIDCSGGTREGLTFQFTDQIGRPLAIRDPDVNIIVLINQQ